jgi:tripartite-type tricarboxylate transporter receptor subunit TctC
MSPVRLGRRTILAAALAAPAIARADTYPKTSVRVVNAYSPGGTADVVCRILCQALSEKLGQTFAVDNKPGAAGTIAAQVVARAPADGYTLLYDATAHSVNPSLFSKLPYDTRRDLLPVFLSLQTPNTLMRNAQFEARTIPELIALAKSKPGALDCASTGIGTVQHVSLELLNQRAGIKINHVPYKEMGSVRNDLFAGRIPLQFSNVPGTIALRSSKEVACMAHTGPGPIDVLPDIHGIAEVLPGFETWERRVRAGPHRSRSDRAPQ